MPTVTSSDTFRLTLPANATVEGGVVEADLTGVGSSAPPEDVFWSTSTSSDYDLEVGNCALVDATAGVVTLTLPLGSDAIKGKRFSMIKIDDVANNALFVPSGSDLIEGTTALAAPTRYSRRDVVWAGDQWRRTNAVLSSSNFLTTTGNLVGIADPKIARQAIGANEHLLQGRLTSVVGATAEVLYLPWPYAVSAGNAFLIDIMGVLNGTTDGDVILTAAVNGGAAASPTLTLPAGAAGTRARATFTAGNAQTADGYITVTVSGANNNAVGCNVVVKVIV